MSKLCSSETAVGHNMDRDKLDEEHSNRQRMLSSELRKVKKDKNVEVSVNAFDKLDGLTQEYGNSSSLAMKLPQSCIKPSK